MIICSEDEIYEVPIEVACNIPYLAAICGSSFREGLSNILDLSSVTRSACQDVLNYATTKNFVLPPTHDRRQEALGLAQYWNYTEYIDIFCDTITAMTFSDKNYIIETINLLVYIDKWSQYREWLDAAIQKIAILSNIHILCQDAIQLFFKLYDQDKIYHNYLFPLLRDWYLGDKDKSKVALIAEYLKTCPLSTFALTPRHRSKQFLELFPDPIFSQRLAKIAIDHLNF